MAECVHCRFCFLFFFLATKWDYEVWIFICFESFCLCWIFMSRNRSDFRKIFQKLIFEWKRFLKAMKKQFMTWKRFSRTLFQAEIKKSFRLKIEWINEGYLVAGWFHPSSDVRIVLFWRSCEKYAKTMKLT